MYVQGLPEMLAGMILFKIFNNFFLVKAVVYHMPVYFIFLFAFRI